MSVAAPPPNDEFRLATRSLKLAALQWGDPTAKPILCLHGWLDNAASFGPLADCLQEFNLVALELPGHGHSEHRPIGSRYHFIDYLWNVIEAIETLGWKQFDLIGHSLGGAVGCLVAAALPQQVQRFVNIEGLGPLCRSPDVLVKKLRQAAHEHVLKRHSQQRIYPSIDSAVEARLAVNQMREQNARAIVERGIEPFQDGFRWRSDPRLKSTTPVTFSEPQALALLSGIQAPVLAIATDPLPDWLSQDAIDQRLNVIPQVTQVAVPGHHHVHMDNPSAIAPSIIEFLQER